MILETRLCTRIPPIVNLFKESGYNSDRKNIQMRSIYFPTLTCCEGGDLPVSFSAMT